MIQQWYYLAALIFSITGLLIIDLRHNLAFGHEAKRTGITLLLSMALFVIWDLIGIGLGIFFHGGSTYTLPFRLAPEFPVEELFFLFLLCYTALLLYLGGKKLWPRT